MARFGRLVAELRRSRARLVPPAFQELWAEATWNVWYGGRASGKSWSIARVLLMQGFERPLRILCCREIQGSIRESAYRLLKDQIRVLDLEGFYDVQADRIVGKNGTEFIFEGLRFNYSKIRSYEGINRLWLEEGQSVSARSLEELIPTVIRNAGIQCYISFNPINIDDPIWTEFVQNPRPKSIVRKVSYKDNPFLSPELQAEREWLLAADPESHDHIWDGNFRQASDAQILRGKYAVEDFEISPDWAGPYHGLDYGFSADPCASVRAHIDTDTRTLYVSAEYWKLGAEIDSLPQELENAIPGISRHTIFADSARPESTNYLQRNGMPHARSAEKWPGSVDDGIAYLRSFARIVLHPSCTHLLDECQRYQFKTDRLTGVPLPEPLDRHNHLIDSLRYALSPLIRNLPTGGYFSRAELLVHGEPLDAADERPMAVFMTASTCDRPSTALALIYWGHYRNYRYPLRVLDFDIAEIEDLDVERLGRIFDRAQELRAELNAIDPKTTIVMEKSELASALAFALISTMNMRFPLSSMQRPPLDINRVDPAMFPPTLDERAEKIRAIVNGGKHIKLTRAAYARQCTHRSITSNVFLGQLLGFRPGAKDTSTEFVNAFALGTLLTLEKSGEPRRVPDPITAPEPLPPEPPRAPPPPMILLTPGPHVINGITVEVPRDGDKDHVFYELDRAGRHEIDGKVAIVGDPRHNVRII